MTTNERSAVQALVDAAEYCCGDCACGACEAVRSSVTAVHALLDAPGPQAATRAEARELYAKLTGPTGLEAYGGSSLGHLGYIKFAREDWARALELLALLA